MRTLTCLTEQNEHSACSVVYVFDAMERCTVCVISIFLTVYMLGFCLVFESEELPGKQ